MQDKVMEKGEIEQRPGCVAAALAILGDKWTPLMVKELAEGRLRFSQLEKKLDGISPRTLSQRLDSMEANRLIVKTHFPEVPPRVEYDLTQKGKELIPILKSMAAWGNKYQTPGYKA